MSALLYVGACDGCGAALTDPDACLCDACRPRPINERRFVTSEDPEGCEPTTIPEMAAVNAEDANLRDYIAELSALKVGESCSLGMFITWTRVA